MSAPDRQFSKPSVRRDIILEKRDPSGRILCERYAVVTGTASGGHLIVEWDDGSVEAGAFHVFHKTTRKCLSSYGGIMRGYQVANLTESEMVDCLTNAGGLCEPNPTGIAARGGLPPYVIGHGSPS